MNEVWERCPNVLPLHLNSIGRCRGFLYSNKRHTMETILHPQQGSLPTKMVNWPLNLEAARKLANKYEQIASTDEVSNSEILRILTGFGGLTTCTLCTSARYYCSGCNRCLYYNGEWKSCIRGESSITYHILESKPNPENLRARASYIREVINKFE